MVLNTVKQDDVTLKEDFTSNTVVEVDDSNTDDTDTGGNSFNPNDNIDSDLTPEEIAQVLQGDGITISNVKITGYDQAIGTFSGGLSEDIGIDSGVILSSGDIGDAAGPNDSDSSGSDLVTYSLETDEDGNTTLVQDAVEDDGDDDLDAILGARTDGRDSDDSSSSSNPGTNDAIVLEFDFVPDYEEFVFEYVFASDEYNEFANSTYNDVFAFLLDGENIALIPGTSTEVSINTINASENASFFRNNDLDDVGVNDLLNTEFDGLTNTLAAQGFVTPGQTYHLKLALADTGDSIYDSAVFLKAGSLSTPPQTGDVTLTPNDLDIFSIESPTDPAFAKLKFTLSETNTSSVNEVGVFTVDDEQGSINGVLPGEKGYEQLALGGVRSRAIFTGLEEDFLADSELSRLINYDVGSKIGFYLVTDGTSDMALSDTPLYFYDPKPQVLFSFPDENPDSRDPLQVTENDSGYTLAWDDSANDGDYDDMILNVEVTDVETTDPSERDLTPLISRRQGNVQKEIIDLSILEDGEAIAADVTVTGESDFENYIGLYRLEDGQGTVIDSVSGSQLSPEDDGYLAAAIRASVFEFDKSDGGGSVILEKGYYAPYMVVEATGEEWLTSNPTNFPHFDTFAYTPFMAADGPDFDYEHLALLGDNTFAFEDQRIAESDFDFDDIIMQIEF